MAPATYFEVPNRHEKAVMTVNREKCHKKKKSKIKNGDINFWF